MTADSRMKPLYNVNAHEGHINCMCLGHKTGIVFATGGDDSSLNLWSCGTNPNPRAILGPLQSAVTACYFSDSEYQIVCGNKGGSVILNDLEKSKSIQIWSAHRSAVNSLRFFDLNTVYSIGNDGFLHTLDIGSKKPAGSINTAKGPLVSLAVSSDGRYVATGGEDKIVRVFDMRTSKELTSFDSHSNTVTAVEFHPSRPILASGGSDRSVHFYDLEILKEIECNTPRHSAPVTVVKFSQDYDCAIAASTDSLSVIGLDKYEAYDRVSLGLTYVYDLGIFDTKDSYIIASAKHGHANISRVKTDNIKPYSYSKSKEGMKSDVRSSVSSVSHVENGDPNSCLIYKDYKSDKSVFMGEMNERLARITRIHDILLKEGFSAVLDETLTHPEYSAELFSMIAERPSVVKLEYSCTILRIAQAIITSSPSLAFYIVKTQLDAFGKVVFANLAMACESAGVDIAKEERREKSLNFQRAFKVLVPDLKKHAGTKTKFNRDVNDFLDEWKKLLSIV